VLQALSRVLQPAARRSRRAGCPREATRQIFSAGPSSLLTSTSAPALARTGLDVLRHILQAPSLERAAALVIALAQEVGATAPAAAARVHPAIWARWKPWRSLAKSAALPCAALQCPGAPRGAARPGRLGREP